MVPLDPQRLLAVPLFAGLALADRERIAAWSYEQEYGPGRAITTEGDQDYAFFVLLDGTATVSHGDRIVRALGPGDHFGEKAILEDGVRTATVTADTTVAALVMIGYRFRELEVRYPEVGAAIHADAARWTDADAQGA